MSNSNPGDRLVISALALLLSVTLTTSPAVSGSPSSAPTKPDIKNDALNLAAGLLKGTSGLRSASNRIKLRSLGVSLIAASDPELARTTCKEIENDITEMYLEASEGEKDRNIQIADLRADAVRTISDADPLIALALLRDTEDRLQHQPQIVRQDAELETYIASRLLDKDPRQAYSLIRASHSESYSAMLPDLIQRLSMRDIGMARDAAGNLAESLLGVDLARRQDAFFVAIGLISLTQTIGGDRDRMTDRREREGLLTKEKEVALLNKLVATATGRRSSADELTPQLASLLPIAEELSPVSAMALRRELESSRQEARRRTVGASDFWERAGDRNLTEALRLIGDEARDARPTLYQQAAMRAISSGNTVLAKEISETFIASANDRQEILKEVTREEVLQAMHAADLSSVRPQLALAGPEERAQLLIEAAQTFPTDKNAKIPLSLLEEASAALNGQPRNVEQLNRRLQLALAFMRFDAERASDLFEGNIAQLNEVLSTAAALDGYLSEGPIVKDGELDLCNTGPIITVYLSASNDIASLAQYDYKRAIEIANQFQRPEAQMMAKLLLAKTVLNPQGPYISDNVSVNRD